MTRALVLVTCLLLAACGGGDDDGIDAPDANVDGNPNACAEPGAIGNEMGVGEYCTMAGGECSDNPGALFCTADVGEAPPFCTKPCGNSGQCGAASTCAGEVDGGSMGCVPNCILMKPRRGR